VSPKRKSNWGTAHGNAAKGGQTLTWETPPSDAADRASRRSTVTWAARISEGSHSEHWKAEVVNERGSLVARISGSAVYVCRLTSAMCERRSVDVSDLFQKQRPLLYCIHGGA
jgi:hypothetical protein